MKALEYVEFGCWTYRLCPVYRCSRWERLKPHIAASLLQRPKQRKKISSWNLPCSSKKREKKNTVCMPLKLWRFESTQIETFGSRTYYQLELWLANHACIRKMFVTLSDKTGLKIRRRSLGQKQSSGISYTCKATSLRVRARGTIPLIWLSQISRKKRW